MKKISILIIFLSFAIVSFAAKTYELKLIVKDLETSKPMAGAKVSTSVNGIISLIGETDSKGEVVISGITEKSITVLVESSNKIYQIAKEIFYNSKKVNSTREIWIKISYDEQMRRYEMIDNQFNDSDEKFIDDLKNKELIKFNSGYYIGGRAAMMKFISENVKYPEDCIMEGIQGKVYLSFFIQKDGRITNVRVARGVHPNLDLEAVRAVRNFPHFSPATLENEPVKQLYYIPINFSLK
jgi:TonB family protein